MENNKYNGIINSVENILDEISNEAKKISFKKDCLVKNLKKDKDSKNIEEVGLELLSLLKNWNLKVFNKLDVLENSIKHANVDQNNIFHRLEKEITEFRNNNFLLKAKSSVLNNNENIDGLPDENVSTSDGEILRPECNVTNSLGNDLVKESIENNSPSNSPIKKRIDLSLINECSTSQESEDEGWVDLSSKVIKTDIPLPKPVNIKQEKASYKTSLFQESTLDLYESGINSSIDLDLADGATVTKGADPDATVPINTNDTSREEREPEDSSSYDPAELFLDTPSSSEESEKTSQIRHEKQGKIVDLNATIETPSVETDLCLVQSNDSCDSNKTELFDTSCNTVLSDHSYTRNPLEDTKLDFDERKNEDDTVSKICADQSTTEEEQKQFVSDYSLFNNPQKHSTILEHDYSGSLEISDEEKNPPNELTKSNSQISTISSGSEKHNELSEYVSPFSVATEKLTSDEDDFSEMQTNLENETQVFSSSLDHSLTSVLKSNENVQKNEEIMLGISPLNNISKLPEHSYKSQIEHPLVNKAEQKNNESATIDRNDAKFLTENAAQDKSQVEPTLLNKRNKESNESVTIDKNNVKLSTNSGEDSKAQDKRQVEHILVNKSERENNESVSVDRNEVELLTESEKNESNIAEKSMDVEKPSSDSDSMESFVFNFEDIGQVGSEEDMLVSSEDEQVEGPKTPDKYESMEAEDTKEVKEVQPDDVPAKPDYRDELLELLKEVAMPSSEENSLEKLTKDNSEQLEDNLEKKKARSIFEMLQNENSNELTDSDTENSSDISYNISDILEESLDSESEEDSEDTSSNREALLRKYNFRECYIALKRVDFKGCEIVAPEYDSDDSINRLCDLSNLSQKRKHGNSSDSSAPAKKSKQSHKNEGSNTDSEDDVSSSDSGLEISTKDESRHDLGPELEKKMDQYWAQQVVKDLNAPDVEEVDEQDDADENKKKHSTKKEKPDYVKKESLSEEQMEKKSWKSDPLLRGTYNCPESPEESDSSRKKKKGYEYDPDYQTYQTSDQIDVSDSEGEENNTLKFQSNLISPIKRNIPISDSSDSDSDIEYVSSKIKSPLKDTSLDLNDDASVSTQKGRRNIRALLSDEALAEGTQKAREMEQERINRLKSRKKSLVGVSQSFCSQSEEGEAFVLEVDEKTEQPLVEIHPKITARMKPHQLDGVQFMWDSCYESLSRIKEDPGSGCILAHCMGLGKTFQVLALIHTLFSCGRTNTNHVLVVCPLSTVNNWEKEVKLAYKNIANVKIKFWYISNTKDYQGRIDIVKSWYSRKQSVLVMGYEAYDSLTNEIKLEKFGEKTMNKVLNALMDPGPDLVVCDEGHLLKNKDSRKNLALNKIKSKRRIILTGTPLQNNLLEYYCMVQFVKPNLLGTLREFKVNFVNPITNGQYQDSTIEDIRLMHKRTHVLHKLLKSTIQRVEDTELEQYLPKMVDHAVFIQLNQVQVELYNTFSDLAQSTNINQKHRRKSRSNFLSDFTVFQNIGTHPQLLRIMEKQRHKRIKESDVITNDKDDPAPTTSGWWKTKLPPDCGERIEYGHKLVVLKAIIEECEALGDKLLVFSQTLGEMDLIEHFLKMKGTERCPSWKKREDYCRMDGTVSPEKRTQICDNFNNKANSKLRLLLMSVKVGGLGLNLTAANRVVIMTVSWNPSYDTQSVFRVYRFGQKKPVYVYRLISLGTMEEKVYQRTINKLATAHRVVDKHQISRHFKSLDLQALYSCHPNADEERPTPNIPEDQMLAKVILNLPCIFSYHEHKALLENRPEDNLTESELASAWEEFRTAQTEKPQVLPIPNIGMAVPNQLPLINQPNYSHALNLAKSKLDSMRENVTNFENSFRQTSQSTSNPFLEKGSGNFQPTAGPSTSTTTATNSINYATSNLPNTQQKQGSEKFTQNDFQKMILPMANLFNNSFLRFTHPNASPTPLYHTKGKENSVAINENNCSEPGTSSSTDIVVPGNGKILNSSSNGSSATSALPVVKQPLITKNMKIPNRQIVKNIFANSQNYIPLRSTSSTNSLPKAHTVVISINPYSQTVRTEKQDNTFVQQPRQLTETEANELNRRPKNIIKNGVTNGHYRSTGRNIQDVPHVNLVEQDDRDNDDDVVLIH